ncbi:MAG TPA: carboxypeptidase-like regulatory domain-containing protein, partial [Acidobacteriota bacterium]|nr:carboxypeptidase-like regulatory domain-containing protein [Acidobacteriota bacterium]
MRLKKIILTPARFISLCVIIALSTAGLPAKESADASPERQTITGKISDQKGAALPRAVIEIRDLQGNIIAVTQSNSRGDYSL